MNRERPAMTDDSAALHRFRRGLFSVLIGVGLFSAASHLLKGPQTAASLFQLSAMVPFAALVVWHLILVHTKPGQRTPWVSLLLILGLAIALFVVGGAAWTIALALAAGTCGFYSRTPVPAVASAAACAIVGLTVGALNNYGAGGTLTSALIGPLAAFLAYSASRRTEAMSLLRRTRADLARSAAAEERLRIARDLHDLLGHSLSLITLKAELAGRLVTSEPARAASEIAELESVARQSLADVRAAVAGFRQPDLAGELVAARQLLDAAGITSQITSSDVSGLAQAVDGALAWAVREGTTNVVRHSRATQVAIRVTAGQGAVVAEIRDNGPAAQDGIGPGSQTLPMPTAGPDGRAAAVLARPVFAGSGLAGLAERVRTLGGDLAAGNVEPQGFLLRVVVPLPAHT